MKNLQAVLFLITMLALSSCNNGKKANVDSNSANERKPDTGKIASAPSNDTSSANNNIPAGNRTFTTKNDLSRNMLYGKVKSVTQVDYTATENVQKGEMQLKVNTLFNVNGSETEQFTYSANGSLYERQTLTDNNKGNRIEGNVYDGAGGLNRKLTFRYDSRDNLVELNSLHPDRKPGDKATSTYDNKGNILEEKFFNSDVDYLGMETFKYDSKGNTTEQDSYTREDSLDSKYTFTYDDKGNPITQEGYPEKGAPVEKFKFKFDNYDKNGNWLREIEYRNGAPFKITERVIEYY